MLRVDIPPLAESWPLFRYRPYIRRRRSTSHQKPVVLARRHAREVRGVVDAALPLVVRDLRIRAQRTRPDGLTVGHLADEQFVHTAPTGESYVSVYGHLSRVDVQRAFPSAKAR